MGAPSLRKGKKTSSKKKPKARLPIEVRNLTWATHATSVVVLTKPTLVKIIGSHN